MLVKILTLTFNGMCKAKFAKIPKQSVHSQTVSIKHAKANKGRQTTPYSRIQFHMKNLVSL